MEPVWSLKGEALDRRVKDWAMAQYPLCATSISDTADPAGEAQACAAGFEEVPRLAP